MPTVYLDSEFRELVKEECEEIKRERAREADEDTRPRDVHVPEREGLKRLLSDEAREELERRRD